MTSPMVTFDVIILTRLNSFGCGSYIILLIFLRTVCMEARQKQYSYYTYVNYYSYFTKNEKYMYDYYGESTCRYSTLNCTTLPAAIQRVPTSSTGTVDIRSSLPYMILHGYVVLEQRPYDTHQHPALLFIACVHIPFR